jgi:hypothetical protein
LSKTYALSTILGVQGKIYSLTSGRSNNKRERERSRKEYQKRRSRGSHGRSERHHISVGEGVRKYDFGSQFAGFSRSLNPKVHLNII